MEAKIKPAGMEDFKICAEIAVKAWQKAYNEYKDILGENLFEIIYPGWEKAKADAMEPYFKKLENLLTLYVLPLVQYLGFKTVFVLGFDGRKERFYESSKRVNKDVKEFIGIEKWIQWEDFHKMEIINIQSSGPLATKLKTVSFEDSLSYCNENI